MLPIAMLVAQNWIAELGDLTPIWGLACVLGMISGIKASGQKRLSSFHHKLGLAGAMTSLLVFILFVIVTVIVSQ